VLPFLLSGVSSYLVFLVLAFSVGYLDGLRRARRAGFETRTAERAYLAFLFGALAGARLFHVLFELPDYYATAPHRVLAFWQGGFSLWGGAAIGLVALLLACRALRVSARALLDAWAPSMLLGVAIGRVGCLLAGCCFGLPTTMPWGIVFAHPDTFVDFPEVPLHPTQAYEAVAALGLAIALRFLDGPPGRRFAVALASYATVRFVVEFFRGDVARGYLIDDRLSVPQLFCLVAAVVAVCIARRGSASPQPLVRSTAGMPSEDA
jgi:phosphatidylglycerol:prolipoprotein diacylglycerol transferase